MSRHSLLIVFTLSTAAPGLAHAGEAAERAAGELLEKRMENQRPADLAILRAVKGKEVIVVRGSMDHVEQVLEAARIRHTVMDPEQVAEADLHGGQIVMVNCPGIMPDAGVRRIERFVRAGGLLYTTDWALLNVVQRAFPGTIAHNGRSTGDHVTPVHVHGAHDNLMSNMLLRKDSKPQWWLEGGSYPIKVLDREKVQVLASSDEMRAAYGSGAVVVRFRWDDGEVIHVVSHFYRQAETRGDTLAAKDTLKSVEGLSAEQKAAFASGAGGGLGMTEVESSYAFQQMTSNLVVGKSKRNQELDREYGWAVAPTAVAAGPVVIDGRAVTPDTRLKVLRREGGKVVVRDDRGNEAQLDEAAVVVR